MKQRILDAVRRLDPATFSELELAVPEIAGDVPIVIAGFPNIILWPWLSEDGFAAITELFESGQLHKHPAEIIHYAHPGRVPALALARGKKAYKHPRWLPCLLSLKPLPKR